MPWPEAARPSEPGIPDPLVARLRAAGCVFAEDEARLLREAAGDDVTRLEAFVQRRTGGEPLEYVIGWAEFGDLRIRVAPGVFVPRRRSELLAREAAALARSTTGGHAVVVDLCCGTGAVGALVAHTAPGIELYAADIDPVAVEVARLNIAPFGGQASAGDLFAALPNEIRGRVDIMTANAPYVPSEAIALMPPEARDYEPLVALDGGEDGLSIQRRVAEGAGEWLAGGGWLLIETSRHQSRATAEMIVDAGFTARIVRDPEIGGTVVVGQTMKGAP
ncbi:putative protein N(5)-glutamine methyltransferase [Sinomonas terrae]|uniref:peptide chain release factor N(5)-glutamine methyltransferase n=1 Tax=Sinomonas terrae TaxID=2908838 RepID=A0ABS9U655_9MICC|nr:putative protein N(5)-glutamine methyltransferase [Sinomonas terrae]MCH6472176.1 putative protein N(5)-glutamine methyltransferase [Sinomonas terrae]